MPAKGSLILNADRNYIFGKKFFRNVLQKEVETELDYKQCKTLIEGVSKVIAHTLRNEPDGFKLPHGMGYLCTTLFKPKKDQIDYKKTKELGKTVYHVNLHSDGLSPHVKWFRVGRTDHVELHDIFKFKTYRLLSRSVAQAMKNGKQYRQWTHSDFYERSANENFYQKKIAKKEDKSWE